MSQVIPKQPETLAQAVEWDRRRGHYLRTGLCHRCAAQAAYGHALGFSRVHSPCAACIPVVANFPVAATNGWRKHVRGRMHAPSPRSEDTVGFDTPAITRTTSAGRPETLSHV